MSAFVLTMFWVYVFCATASLFDLFGEHPRSRPPFSVGADSAAFILNLALVAWAAYLTWGAS